MQFTTKYINPTTYLNYFGENLDNILPDDDLPSGKAERFIKRVEDEVALLLEVKCFKRIEEEYIQLSDFQKECYQKALLYQVKYKIKNGDIANDSGYDPQTGKVIGNNDLESIELSRNTIRYLELAGLWNKNINSKLFGGGFYPVIR